MSESFAEVVCQEQPRAEGWKFTNSQLLCPPGLQPLLPTSKLILKQVFEFGGILPDSDAKNKYIIKNDLDEKIYFAVEESEYCMRMCCGPNREFDMKVMDPQGSVRIHTKRPLVCESCCSCIQQIEIFTQPDTLIGSVEKKQWSLGPKFLVKDAAGETVLKIRRWIEFFEFCSTAFVIFSKDEKFKVGKITKKFSGFVREFCSTSDLYEMTFPIDLDVKIKATLIGAVFLIDAMYFEK